MASFTTDLEVRIREFGRKVSEKSTGATAVEYALMVALIAIVIIGAVTILGQGISETFTSAADQIPPG